MKSMTRRYCSILKSIIFNKAERVFCISMQRNGTTSVGRFLRDFGFRTAGWSEDERNDWSGSWYNGDYDTIFSSIDFKTSNAFEDSPWWLPDFYKILSNRFPRARFILFTRDPDAWFSSMIKHSGGNIIGRGQLHCKIYRRELEYFDLLNSGEIDEVIENKIHSEKQMKITMEHASRYKKAYRLHTIEVQDFFRRNAPEILHVGKLEDPHKWQKMGKFLGINVPVSYECHENQSKT